MGPRLDSRELVDHALRALVRESSHVRPHLVFEVLALLFVGTATRAGEDGRLVSSQYSQVTKDRDACISAKLPVSFSGRIGLAHVFVNGTPETFVIDTASDTIINSDRLQLLVLRAMTASTATTSGSLPLQWELVNVRQFGLGNTKIRNIGALSRSLRAVEQGLGREIDGILGNDILNQWDSVTLDYKKRMLVLGCSKQEARRDSGRNAN
ncbi:MAG: aspartyl protease family protein [Acidobacteriaceae bacterium]|nr:aspartyl protease family protein [Acidobacteriaceae bacterium]MBV9779260.1 aspartyl protease family protein [Acidobacteriaceae bacterium]